MVEGYRQCSHKTGVRNAGSRFKTLATDAEATVYLMSASKRRAIGLAADAAARPEAQNLYEEKTMTIEELILRSGRAAGHLKNEPPSDKSMAGKSRYVLARNAKFPYYGECAYCGGNWGWKKGASHTTRLDVKGRDKEGLFLFCEQCDKAVTKAQRGEALDAWKAEVLGFINPHFKNDSPGKILNYVARTLTTELIEFPRKQIRGLQRRR